MLLPASVEAETLMLLPVILCSVHMSFSICDPGSVVFVRFVFFNFCSSKRKKSNGMELQLLGVLWFSTCAGCSYTSRITEW